MPDYTEDDLLWSDPVNYIRNAVDAGVRANNEREKTVNQFQAQFPDVDLGQAGFVSNRDAKQLEGMTTAQAIQHVGQACRNEMGSATSSANPGSAGAILNRRKKARTAARHGLPPTGKS